MLQARSDEELWCERSRRRVLHAIIAEWTQLGCGGGKSKDPGNTVKTLVAALSLPGWFDVKLRVIKLLEENCVPD